MNKIACELEGHKISDEDREKYRTDPHQYGKTGCRVSAYICTRCGVTGWYSEMQPDEKSRTSSSMSDYLKKGLV